MRSAYIIILFSSFLLLQGCCTKAHCTGIEEEREVTFSGFTLESLDGIAVEVFVAGSGLSTRLDSSFHGTGDRPLGSGDIRLYLTDALNPAHDYRFTLLSGDTGQVFRVTDLVVKRRACNSCFPYHPESDYFDQLSGYSVNGRAESGMNIIIRP